jgi:DNA-binding Lrp family transcriptional regulator
MKTTTILALCVAFAAPAVAADADREHARALRAAERRAKLFFAARKPKKIYRTVSRDVKGSKEVKISKKVKVGSKWVRRRVTETRKTIEKRYFMEVNARAVGKSWHSYLQPSVQDEVDKDSLLDLVGSSPEQEFRLLKAIEEASRAHAYRPKSGGQSQDLKRTAQANLDAYLSTCWPLALTKVKHLRTVCSRSSVTMWHRASEVQITRRPGTKNAEGPLVPVESEKKHDKSLLRTLPAKEIMTVWVRVEGKFYLSAVVEEVSLRGGRGIKLRAVEGEVLRSGPGMTADELIAQAHDGVSGNVELGEVSDTGFLQGLRSNGSGSPLAEVRVGTNTLWLCVDADSEISRLKKLKVNSAVSFRGNGWVTTQRGKRVALIRGAVISVP